MEHSTHRGLAFLLSLGTLPLACKPDEGTTESGTGTTTGPETSTDGSSGLTGTSTVVTDSSSSDSSGDPTGGSGGLCEQFAAFYVVCEPSKTEKQLIMECEELRREFAGYYGPTCLPLYDEFLACFVTGSCGTNDTCVEELMAAYYCKPEIGEVCQAYAMKYVECMRGGPEAAEYCQIGLNSSTYQYGPACGAAYEEWIVCLTGLDCAAFKEEIGCEAQVIARDQACS